VVLTRLDLRGLSTGDDLAARLPRPEIGGDQPGDRPVEVVREVLAEVRKRGDAAVREYTERFDRVAVEDLRVPPSEIAAALDALPAPLRTALEAARDAIEAHHCTQLRPESTHERDGVVIRELWRPVARAGCYVPGGRARSAAS